MWEIIKKIFRGIGWTFGILAAIIVCIIGGYFLRTGVDFVCLVLELLGVSWGIIGWIESHQTAVWVICAIFIPILWLLSIFFFTDSISSRDFGGGGGVGYRSNDEEGDFASRVAAAMAKENEKIMFVDCSGRYRQWGDSFVDYSGKWCQWGDTFCDADGNYIRWGETYKDSSGAYRNFGDDFVDYAGNWVHIS